MTTETVDLHCSVDVTALAELSRCVDRQIISVISTNGVALNAPDEAVSLGPNAQMYRDLSVMQQIFKMIATHDLIRFNTRLTFAAWVIRQTDIGTRTWPGH
ncbi:uncharacterized protein METZ01_LOCUS169768 [marine metagenome]|uniref:Uncharacterized protein n=1 Tax=marine metagenome TaxID=408172 RepID=A0A382BTE0_9ZZZZ